MTKINQELIQQLRDGEIILENDGTLEELQEVLSTAFPKDNKKVNKDDKYKYYFLNSYSTRLYRHNRWGHSLPHQEKKLERMCRSKNIKLDAVRLQNFFKLEFKIGRKEIEDLTSENNKLKEKIEKSNKRIKTLQKSVNYFISKIEELKIGTVYFTSIKYGDEVLIKVKVTDKDNIKGKAWIEVESIDIFKHWIPISRVLRHIPVPAPEPETVEINGKKYLKSDIENLKPVE